MSDGARRACRAEAFRAIIGYLLVGVAPPPDSWLGKLFYHAYFDAAASKHAFQVGYNDSPPIPENRRCQECARPKSMPAAQGVRRHIKHYKLRMCG